jgi:hypothetical protein
VASIVGISGKKQSGKSSCGNFLFGSAMLSTNLVDYAQISSKGELIVPFEAGGGDTKPCIFPVDSMHPSMIDFMTENIWPHIKIYNFADNLKRICIDVLGLTERQCYGTDEEKNSTTNIRLPDTLAEKKVNRAMTAREVMQYVGTDFFRQIYPQVWVDSTIRRIEKDSTKLAVVVDCRFPNEVKGIQESGGKVIRLTRNIFGDSDQHPSETALDNYEGFDFVLDNQKMSVEEQNETIYNKLVDWGFVDYKAVATIIKQ